MILLVETKFALRKLHSQFKSLELRILSYIYCDLRGRIKGAARALYPVHVERAQYGQY